MKTIILFLFVSFNSFALTPVDNEGQVFRGREPKASAIHELSASGISDVIIFKNEINGEVEKEKQALNEVGIASHHIPFHWKDFPSMIEACEQTAEALNLIHEIKLHNGKVFFHCTAGEDRTGMLAGLYRMLEEKASSSLIFKTEMCQRGYSDGDTNKPRAVVTAIEKGLTPLFLTLSQKIESGEWKLGQIKKSSCRNIRIAPTDLKCKG